MNVYINCVVIVIVISVFGCRVSFVVSFGRVSDHLRFLFLIYSTALIIIIIIYI